MNVANLIKKKSYEKVEYVLRRHAFTFIPQIILFIGSFIFPILIYLMINNLFPTLLNNTQLFAAAVLVASIYYLSILLLLYTQFVDFYLDVWIVTNDRIVDIEQFGLFSRTISELDLFRIQDVTADVKGMFATLFKYGDLLVKTASNNPSIVFRNIPNPNYVRQHLLELANSDYRYHRDHP